MRVRPQFDMNDTEKKPYWRDAVVVFARMSGWIIGPILLALFLGKWLDARLHTAPILFAVTMGLGFLVSSFGIVRESQKYLRTIEKKNPPTTKPINDNE